jgi:hypothetical protein
MKEIQQEIIAQGSSESIKRRGTHISNNWKTGMLKKKPFGDKNP